MVGVVLGLHRLFSIIVPYFLLTFINGKIKCPLLGEEESLDREEKIKRKT